MEAGAIANAAMTQLALAQKMIKMNADSQKQIAGVLEQAADNIAALTSRGTTVNFTA